MSLYSFWPPPPSTSVASSRIPLPVETATLGGVAHRIATELDQAGYRERRWYPIGLEYRHGFVATTRLEAVNDGAAPKPESERWSSQYPEGASVRWLLL